MHSLPTIAAAGDLSHPQGQKPLIFYGIMQHDD